MADPVSGVGNNFSRVPQAATVANLQANSKVAQTIIQQLQKPAVALVRTSAVTQTAKPAISQPTTNLPRGSLVDRLV